MMSLGPRPFACYTVIAIQILVFVTLTSIYGFAPKSRNQFIGPPTEITDYYGAKNSARIKEGEFWRVFTALFHSVGLVDLSCSICMLVTFGQCLEKRWGSRKWLSIYIITGICGNTYSVFSEPDSISVGNGASTLGLLGAIYVDLITSILSQSKKQGSTLNPIDENCFVRSAVVSSGMLIGVIVTCILQGGNFPEKDWSVLYGGMIAGILCGSIWNIFTVKFDLGMKWYYCTALTIVPLLLSGLFCLQMLR